MELYHSLASGLDGSWFSDPGPSAPPALLILTIGELLHRKGAIFFCCGCVPSGFKLRCCTIVNKPFMNGLGGPVPQENLFFASQAREACSGEWCKM